MAIHFCGSFGIWDSVAPSGLVLSILQDTKPEDPPKKEQGWENEPPPPAEESTQDAAKDVQEAPKSQEPTTPTAPQIQVGTALQSDPRTMFNAWVQKVPGGLATILGVAGCGGLLFLLLVILLIVKMVRRKKPAPPPRPPAPYPPTYRPAPSPPPQAPTPPLPVTQTPLGAATYNRPLPIEPEPLPTSPLPKKCPVCGGIIPREAKFCGMCGVPVSQGPSPSPVPAFPPQVIPPQAHPSPQAPLQPQPLPPAQALPPPPAPPPPVPVPGPVPQMPQSPLPQGASAPQPQIPSPTGCYLQVWHTDGNLRQYPLSPLTRIGREVDNDLRLEEISISRHHATLQLQGDTWILTDLNSSNGTLVRGNRIRQPQSVQAGEIFYLGTVRVLVQKTL